jgi:tRNA (cytidine/uridine-2'-O-)-methyltransferase
VRIALYQPDIPQNVGATMRLAACLAIGLDIIEPCGFPLTDKALKRAALDYSALVAPVRWASFAAYRCGMAAAGRRLVLVETDGRARLEAFRFAPGDVLILGRESAGSPAEVHNAAAASLRIPLAPGARSLNVVTAAAIAVGEALRQTGGFEALP